MEADLKIRFAVREEASEIAAVIREAFAEFESSYTPEAFAATIPPEDKICERFDAGKVWAATLNEKIVATVSTVAEGEKLHLRSMAVLPDAQGQGVGQKLLGAVESFAVENGFKSLFLYTTPFLTGAIRLYEKNGFERGESGTEGFYGTAWFAMEKKLNETE